MNKIQKKSMYQLFKKPIIFVGALILLAGIYSYLNMRKSLFPEVQFPRITLIADAGEQPVDRMMITVTKPLESAVKKVQGVTTVKSSTSRGSCVIDVYFKWGMDIYALKAQLESRVNEIKNYLPAGTVISTEVMNQSLYPVYGYTLKSKTHGSIEMRDVANLVVRPLFSQVDGISNVVIHGGKAKEFVVIPDATKMSSLGITPKEIVKAFQHTNFIEGNGMVKGYHRLYLTLTDTRIRNVRQLENTVIKGSQNRMVYLSDIARVEVQEQREFLKINADGDDAVLIDLVKQPGVNLLTFAKNVKAKEKEVQKALPAGYELKTYYDQSAFVGSSIYGVVRTIIEGLFLAILVMVLFLRSWRASSAVMLTIPVTLALSILLVKIAGISLNIMSLGAIAASVGLILDDAIVIIEQIYREQEDHPQEPRTTVVHTAIHNLFPAMVASSLSTIIIYFPFRMMSGMAGAFFKDLAITMQLTLLASFFVTWILLPTLYIVISGKKVFRPRHPEKTGNSTEQDAVRKVRWLTKAYRHPVIVILFVMALIGGGWLSYHQMQTGFLPDLDEGTIVLDYHSPSGTDIEETDRLCREMEKIIMSHPVVETYSRRTALGMSFDVKPSNFGDYLIQLKPGRKETTPEVINDLRKEIAQKVPVMTVDFGQRISDLLGDLMSTPNPIEIKIFGNNYRQLEQLSVQAEHIMKHTHGVVDIDNGLVPAGSSIVYIPNEQLLSQYGISLDDFSSQLSCYIGGVPLSQPDNVIEPAPQQAAMTGGLQIGSIQDGEQLRRVLLRFVDFKDNDPAKIMHEPVFLPDGTTRPVSYFCRMSVIPGEIEQKREDLKADITLTARLEGRDLGSTVKDLQQQFHKKLNLPKGYTLQFGGAYSQQQQSFSELLTILLIATLLVFSVLLFLFRKWGISLAILFISVLGVGGSLLALYITGTPLNVSSYTGIIMVVGIIAENAIFTVNQYDQNRQRGGAVAESVDYAIALRIRPKLMTAISAVLALMPLALGIGVGAQMQQPLAVAVIGGFCVALPLLLLVLPCLMLKIFR
ncbi:MAG: efflux RND transporter permease subunit [Prevotella sp.]|jgi:multidrug efflux pump subunit AcrB|nr:efflux RND transporter permease subunit [Prevotella sp.]MCH4212991.1 efflux RND transporter permease subunit [Prevotella sp.]MCH4242131.1 efflux RND transporter permease subunit [Prevotella sp.]MCI1742286.1 efflux RND transporter permease subunit [Prevotella sp.]